MKRAFLLCALLAGVAASAPAPAPASAAVGSYPVPACNRAPNGQNNSWQLFNLDIAHLVTGSACPPRSASGEQAKTSGLYATDSLTGTGNAASEGTAGWIFKAPEGMSIVSFQADRYLGAYGDNGWVPSITADGTTLESCTFSFPAEQCSVGEPLGAPNSLGSAIPVNNATTLKVGITCTGGSGCLPGATIHHAWAALYGATVTLSETADPSVQNVSGALWGPGSTGGFHKGIESVTALATDPSGIAKVAVLVDGVPAVAKEGVCDYTFAIPCQNAAPTVSLNTASVPDGTHTLTLVIYDAAGNETRLTHQVTVANTAPTAPVGISAKREPDGSDTVSWSDPPHVAPIAQANYQLCSLSSGACRAAQSLPDHGTLTGIVPPGGRWQIRVWLADSLGNVNPALTASVQLPARLILGVHHRLAGRRLTLIVLAPRGVVGPVSIAYQARRGHRTLARGSGRVKIRHGRAQLIVRLPASASHDARLSLTAQASFAQPATLSFVLPRHKG
jgi:hypothetical protein